MDERMTQTVNFDRQGHMVTCFLCPIENMVFDDMCVDGVTTSPIFVLSLASNVNWRQDCAISYRCTFFERLPIEFM